MNKCIFIGRLAKDPEISYTQQGMKVAKYSLAVQRRKDGADFVPITAFEKTADFAEKYLKKGMKISISARYSADSYEKDGKKYYTHTFIAEEHEFCESKGQSKPQEAPSDSFMDIPEGYDEGLPFN